MNEIKVFQNKEFGEIRTATLNGEPMFVAADVCRALEIGNPTMALSRLDADEQALISIEGISKGNDNCNAVTESGLYSLVLGSRKPEAKAFKRWITHDVIPTIRKTGGYVNDDELFLKTYLPQADEQTKLFFKTTLATMKNLNAQIEASKPKVIFADAVAASGNVILVGELAKILKGNGCEMGQKRLFERLRSEGYLIKRDGLDRNMPTQRSMELGLFKIKETAITHSDGHVTISKTTLVTGKGQEYFVNRFSEKAG